MRRGYSRCKVAKSIPGNDRGTKEERRARRLANLRSPIKKGEVRNPTGRNGRERSDYIVGILDELDKGEPRIRRVVLAAYRRALKGSDPAAKFLGEQYGGKARQLIDLTSSDRSMSPGRKPTTAETRQELDRVMASLNGGVNPEVSTGEGEAPAEPKAEP
jgi:hypothetical protein